MFKFTLKDVAVNKRTINPYAGLPKKGSLFRIHPDNFIQSYVLFQHYNWHLLVGEELIETVAEASFIPGIFLANLYQATDNYDNNYIVVVSLAGTGQHYLPVMEEAKGQWYERIDNEQSPFEPRPDYAKQPIWTADFEALMNQAFEGLIIDALDHHLLAGKLKKTSKV